MNNPSYWGYPTLRHLKPGNPELLISRFLFNAAEDIPRHFTCRLEQPEVTVGSTERVNQQHK